MLTRMHNSQYFTTNIFPPTSFYFTDITVSHKNDIIICYPVYTM